MRILDSSYLPFSLITPKTLFISVYGPTHSLSLILTRSVGSLPFDQGFHWTVNVSWLQQDFSRESKVRYNLCTQIYKHCCQVDLLYISSTCQSGLFRPSDLFRQRVSHSASLMFLAPSFVPFSTLVFHVFWRRNQLSNLRVVVKIKSINFTINVYLDWK
jgi:hypothetical protein